MSARYGTLTVVCFVFCPHSLIIHTIFTAAAAILVALNFPYFPFCCSFVAVAFFSLLPLYPFGALECLITVSGSIAPISSLFIYFQMCGCTCVMTSYKACISAVISRLSDRQAQTLSVVVIYTRKHAYHSNWRLRCILVLTLACEDVCIIWRSSD